jgi:hypothetical protein
MKSLVVALCIMAAAVTAAGAQGAGSGQLAGQSILTARGCRRDRASFSVMVVTDGAGTWSAEEAEGVRFTGTWTAKGRSGRRLELAFDPSTEDALVAAIVGDVPALCGVSGPVTVTSVVRKSFKLLLNRKRTRATLTLSYAISGRAGGRSGTAHYRVRARGPWTPTA